MLQEFYDNIEKLGISREAIQEEKDEECTLLTFFVENEQEIPYNIALIFYQDENAEIYIRSLLQNYDLLETLKKINTLNGEYCGVTFLLANDMLTVKSYCKENSDIEFLFLELKQDLEIAQEEFKRFRY
ncbi:hypothetical protein LIZ62_13865 [Fusicatenibacter saccharivorans]|uniref:hypothetical protein n=1 Tax=Fusicatenibacter saccharivorans TaxID=1150298 RepID=UPI001D05DF1E|nr:hypothetical protein [Fusicatenibacter saccharivorans]MCB7101311.1 hypothetical protein [Fusicatenibacter saccharivorans]